MKFWAFYLGKRDLINFIIFVLSLSDGAKSSDSSGEDDSDDEENKNGNTNPNVSLYAHTFNPMSHSSAMHCYMVSLRAHCTNKVERISQAKCVNNTKLDNRFFSRQNLKNPAETLEEASWWTAEDGVPRGSVISPLSQIGPLPRSTPIAQKTQL